MRGFKDVVGKRLIRLPGEGPSAEIDGRDTEGGGLGREERGGRGGMLTFEGDGVDLVRTGTGILWGVNGRG